jgi:hypothetical protein
VTQGARHGINALQRVFEADERRPPVYLAKLNLKSHLRGTAFDLGRETLTVFQRLDEASTAYVPTLPSACWRAVN